MIGINANTQDDGANYMRRFCILRVWVWSVFLMSGREQDLDEVVKGK